MGEKEGNERDGDVLDRGGAMSVDISVAIDCRRKGRQSAYWCLFWMGAKFACCVSPASLARKAWCVCYVWDVFRAQRECGHTMGK